MNADKALIPIDGQPLLSLVALRLMSIFSEVAVVGPCRTELSPNEYIWISDRPGYADPMGAILTALDTLKRDWIFVCAVDMPGLHLPLIRHLCSLAEKTDEYDMIVPVGIRGIEPLHALYSPRSVAVLESMRERGDLSLQKMGEGERVRLVTQDELEAAGVWKADVFANLNTREDVEAFCGGNSVTR